MTQHNLIQIYNIFI